MRVATCILLTTTQKHSWDHQIDGLHVRMARQLDSRSSGTQKWIVLCILTLSGNTEIQKSTNTRHVNICEELSIEYLLDLRYSAATEKTTQSCVPGNLGARYNLNQQQN
jgi:hypothetical protein